MIDRGFSGILIVPLVLLVLFFGFFMFNTEKPITKTEPIFKTKDYNFLLDKEGYKIFFRITEDGQLSLVHPQ